MGATGRQGSLVAPSAPYQPDQGDLAWINCEPQAGREPAKNRPALVLTKRQFNVATGLLMACPVTRPERPFGSRVALVRTDTPGWVMVEQVKSLDWRARGAAFVEAVPAKVLHDVHLVLGTILDL